MKPIKQYLSQHKSTYAAAKYHQVDAMQLHRLKDSDAIVDEAGQVWIKSKTVLKLE
ncbi:hypothetical protein S349_58 [Shewanella sp. phage 3/49]|uniref:hypothetical protein n=1 Tax=Shewanella sp. phage 3/49 TaxID=1458863 RepID=UPI0004F8748F|nr:hypothetical protein S349_58 [Shewanella sp. phage 3/49]AHK11848.1 hypothetical protein S349_58 [Shewanella sp. phage 3/49]